MIRVNVPYTAEVHAAYMKFIDELLANTSSEQERTKWIKKQLRAQKIYKRFVLGEVTREKR